MKEEDRQELVMEAAAKVHEAWCRGELQAFYGRFVAEKQNGASIQDALQSACNKNGKPRNEVELDTKWLNEHTSVVNKALETFENFMSLLDCEVVVVKRFTKRTLTDEEQKRMGSGNYKADSQEENILRPFKKLSADSQKENLEAAKGALSVYEEYAKRGATLDELSSPENKKDIGTLIHADWMRRNELTDANKHLFVPYEELDDWTKQQDLDVFDALIQEVQKTPEKYSVEVEQDLKNISPEAIEKSVLDAKTDSYIR